MEKILFQFYNGLYTYVLHANELPHNLDGTTTDPNFQEALKITLKYV